MKYADLPELPKKTWFKMYEAKDLDQRKRELNDYLMALCKKEALTNDGDFHSFINLEENLNNKLSFNKEKLLYNFPDANLGVREFVLIEEQKIVIAVCRDENVQSRVKSYWDNIRLPFIHTEDSFSPVGSFVVFKIVSQDPWHVEKLFVKNFKSQTNCVAFCRDMNVLAVGLSNGKVRIFDIPKEFKFIKDVYYDSSSIKAHSGQINGLAIDASLGYVYSIGTDSKLCVSDRTSGEVVWTVGFDKFELTTLTHDEEKKRLFIGDNSGTIHIFSIKRYPPKRLATIKTSIKTTLKSITFSDDYKKMFAGSIEGDILCFDLGDYGREKKDTKEYPYILKGKGKCQSLVWDENNKCILSGNKSGNIAIWLPEENRCLYVFNAHLHKVTSLHWDREQKRLITGSSDGKIKVWTLPHSFIETAKKKKLTLGKRL